jgi:peptidyl-prolyl cis-trans isomerase SurA
MKKIVIPILLSSLGSLGCLAFSSAFAAEVVDRVVAVVGSEIVTLSDIKNYSAQRSFQAKFGAPDSKDSKDPLEALIRDKLLKQEMDRLGIATTEQDIDSGVQEVLKRNNIPLEVLKSELAKKGTPFAQFKKEMSDQIIRMKFLGQVIFPRIKISEEEIARKTNGNSSDEARFRSRMEILEARAPEELSKYLEEVRAKTYVEIKK